MKNCNIIKDLLPSYIEKLTSTETNFFIEKHLEECEECKNTFKNMNKNITDNIEIDEKVLQTKEVRFLKNMNKKMFKKALILGTSIGILILLIIYICIVIYRFSIIENLSNKYSSFQKLNNIYLEVNDNYIADNLQFVENLKTQYWYKDNIIKVKQSSSKYDFYNSFTRYIDLKNKKIYVFNDKDKTVEIIDRENVEENNEIFIMLNSKYVKKLNDKIKLSMNIYAPIYNKNNDYTIVDMGVGNQIYDSETGLLNISYYYEYTGNEVNLYNHHFQTYTYSNNSVEDSDVCIPNLNKYVLTDEII